MYIKKSVIIVIFLIPFLTILLVGEYFYLNNKFSPIRETLVNKEKKIVKQTESSPTPTIDTIKGVSIQVTPVPTVTPSINIEQVQNYLNTLLSVKTSWQNVKDKISSEDYNFLMDSFERQINFCQTIIDHLSKNPNPSNDDLILWQGVQKMWGETGELTNKLNKDLIK